MIDMQRNYNRKEKPEIVISKPSAIEVEKYLKSWKNLKNYQLQEDSLDKLFFELFQVMKKFLTSY